MMSPKTELIIWTWAVRLALISLISVVGRIVYLNYIGEGW